MMMSRLASLITTIHFKVRPLCRELRAEEISVICVGIQYHLSLTSRVLFFSFGFGIGGGAGDSYYLSGISVCRLSNNNN